MGKPKKIRVLVVEPGKDPEIRDIENTLEAKQAVVGGYIEVVPLDVEDEFPLKEKKHSIDLIVNEEGKINNLPYNRRIWDGRDFIAGTAMVALGNADTGNFESLTEEAEAAARKLLAKG